ncbi:hypothetical protein BVC80_9051g65 [Macleaya cordata]|uniref:Uncharacterized protein n=1 Tax=Macleaya cordata TaxID=56857 RepID=A0A200RA14_MACCD|nr:hypothetical protein BVC80_9051g65 [Macleaya cordata]
MVRGLPAVSTNTTGAANSGHSISTYLDIFDFELMRRHEYAGGLGYGPQPGSPTLSTTLSHSEIDELRELLRYRQAEIERLREMNQVQLQDNQVLGQQNRLNNLNGNSTNNNGDSPRLNYNSS